MKCDNLFALAYSSLPHPVQTHDLARVEPIRAVNLIWDGFDTMTLQKSAIDKWLLRVWSGLLNPLSQYY